jgi:hypothetical protein
MPSDRSDFLIHVYDQMFNDINTHILVVWQSIAVVVGALAVFGLAEKNIITIDLATAIVVLLCAWLMAHLYDASYWYNRNLVIIANIERQFLVESDLRDVHYYFGKHRKKSSMLTHLRIQWHLAVWLAILLVCFHFATRVLPGIGAPWRNFDPERVIPYGTILLSAYLLGKLRTNRRNAYAEFLENSPGRQLNVAGIRYGIGHPTDAEAQADVSDVPRQEASQSGNEPGGGI